MKRSKFSEEQVAYALRQTESGTAVGDVCRQVSEPLGVVGRRSHRFKVSRSSGRNWKSLVVCMHQTVPGFAEWYKHFAHGTLAVADVRTRRDGRRRGRNAFGVAVDTYRQVVD